MRRWANAVWLALLAGGALAPVGRQELESVQHALRGAGRCTETVVELRRISAEFRPVEIAARPEGWETPHAAAVAFFDWHGPDYQATDESTELVGFLLRTAAGRYVFTTAAEVPFAFRLTAGIRRPRGWTVHAMLHTHPGGRPCQEEFSREDRDTVLSGATPRSYLRTPLGNVLFLERELATLTSTRGGAAGVSVCAHAAPCLAPHGSLLARRRASP
jgi:hypothetical protein